MASPSAEPDPAPGPEQGDATNPADTALDAVLAELWAESARHGGPLSLARLCKRTKLRMSTLKRLLTLLEASDVVVLSRNARDLECAMLSDSAAATLGAALGAADQDEP